MVEGVIIIDMKNIKAAGNLRSEKQTPGLSGLRMNTIPNPTLLILSTGFPRDLKGEHSYEAFRKLGWKKAKKQLP